LLLTLKPASIRLEFGILCISVLANNTEFLSPNNHRDSQQHYEEGQTSYRYEAIMKAKIFDPRTDCKDDASCYGVPDESNTNKGITKYL
jgi:hypothetical protein